MNKTYTSILSAIVVAVCSVRFLLDGIKFGNWVFPHTEDMVYTALLTPVLVAHGYMKTRLDTINLNKIKIDDPDKQ